jgi:hypothetical protein
VGRPSNNFFFAHPQHGHPCNLDSADTPVSIPKVWWAWKHDWVQWNAFVENPLGRNLAQALALGASPDTEFPLLKSLDWLEEQVEKLRPPSWKEVFGAPTPGAQKLAELGKKLYHDGRPDRPRPKKGLCAHCHVPEKKQNPDGKEEWKVVLIPVKEIGTDDGTMDSYLKRPKKATGGAQAQDFLPAPWLEQTTSTVMTTRFLTENISDYDRKRMQRHRTNSWPRFDQYKAPPHEGVWATAPYLHNGSVPTLYHLLSPKDGQGEATLPDGRIIPNSRPRSFCVASLEFDPVLVGFKTDKCAEGEIPFNVEETGNSNKGHEFKNAANCEKREGDFAEDGVLGCELSHDERMAIIEYLKTLPEESSQTAVGH